MVDRQPSNNELQQTRTNRVAALRYSAHQRYIHYLDLARRTRIDNGFETEGLDTLLKHGHTELDVFGTAVGGRIQPRRRPQNGVGPNYTLFLDECGSHNTTAKEKFPVFCLTGIIVLDSVLPALDRKWKRWKATFLGSPSKKVHEPDIRDRSNSFWCDGDRDRQDRAILQLDKILSGLPYLAVTCVVHRDEYSKIVEKGQSFDESLPQHIYLMSIDFLMERVALTLDLHLGGGKAHIVAESRGSREDAGLQYEVARLFLDGTTYLSAAFFRNQFYPGLEFLRKQDNSTGLQLADLVARACGDKVSDPSTTPARWRAVQKKLCQGIETEHSILGLKIVPWNEKYVDIWKS